MVKPKKVAGVVELLPVQQKTLDGLIEDIKNIFELFGFVPISTPLFEYKEVLLSKSSPQTQKQVYFLSSSGTIAQRQPPKYAIRYDLTVPLARYVAQNQEHLSFPFKRYQIQQVYRGESPQQGRFREFYQCDVDVIGRQNLSGSYDGEMVVIAKALLTEIALGDFKIHISNRNLFKALFKAIQLKETTLQERIIREIDKVEKRGVEPLKKLLEGEIKLKKPQVEMVLGFINLRAKHPEELGYKLDKLGISNEFSLLALSQLSLMFEVLKAYEVNQDFIKINLKIARGLDYYTGNIFEAVLDDYKELGSVCSGGRYDNLVQNFCRNSFPGVGVSFGLSRILPVYLKKNQPKTGKCFVMIANLDYTMSYDYANLAKTLRKRGIATLVYMQKEKLSKQMSFANKSSIDYVLLYAKNEKEKNVITVKNFKTGKQTEVAKDDVAEFLLKQVG